MKLLSPELKETLRLKGKYTFKWFSFFILLLVFVFIICYYQGWHHKKKEVKPKYRVNYLPHDWVPPSHLTKVIVDRPVISYVDREVIKEVEKPIYVDREVIKVDTTSINNLTAEINEKKQLITELEAKINTLIKDKEQLGNDNKAIQEQLNTLTKEKEALEIKLNACLTEHQKESLDLPTPLNSHIEIINGVKHHHYIVPDSEFDTTSDRSVIGCIEHNCKTVYLNDEGEYFNDNLQSNLIHRFIKKISPGFLGWICWSPSFNECNNNSWGTKYNLGQTDSIMTEIKHPPLDLVAIYFDKGERYSTRNSEYDWDKYTFDEVIKKTNGAENVYYFWRTPKMTKIFEESLKQMKHERAHLKINEELNKPRCPKFAKLLTEEDIEQLKCIYTYDELIDLNFTEEELNKIGIFKPTPPPKPTPSNDREGDSPFTTTITTRI